MTLYNKDGTVYKLNGPNPAMKNQEIWSKYTLHNMTWSAETAPDHTQNETKNNIVVETSEKEFIEELKSTIPNSYQNQESQNLVEKEKEKELTTKQIFASNKKSSQEIEKTFIYCLPMFQKEKKDSLYGDEIKRSYYGSPTSFEAVILKTTDFTIELWTEINLLEGSILYPKNGDKRWWKVQKINEKLGGWIIVGVPSQEQPSFE